MSQCIDEAAAEAERDAAAGVAAVSAAGGLEARTDTGRMMVCDVQQAGLCSDCHMWLVPAKSFTKLHTPLQRTNAKFFSLLRSQA